MRTEIERARRVGLISQQLARYASKRLRQSHERLNLSNTLQSVLAQRAREVASRGIHVRQSTRAIEVLVDRAGAVGEIADADVTARRDRNRRAEQGRDHHQADRILFREGEGDVGQIARDHVGERDQHEQPHAGGHHRLLDLHRHANARSVAAECGIRLGAHQRSALSC